MLVNVGVRQGFILSPSLFSCNLMTLRVNESQNILIVILLFLYPFRIGGVHKPEDKLLQTFNKNNSRNTLEWCFNANALEELTALGSLIGWELGTSQSDRWTWLNVSIVASNKLALTHCRRYELFLRAFLANITHYLAL